MTDGTRILRTIGVPVVIAVILLVVLPRMCARAINAARVQTTTDTVSSDSASSAASSPGGLHISTTSPDASPARPQNYPAGLDAERIQYLIEIDPSFVQSGTMHVPKDVSLWSDADSRFPVLPVVTRLGYFQATGGSYAPTREAALHLEGMTEEAGGWLVPVGKRRFGSVARLEDLGDARYRATFRWQWEPNAVGGEILPKPKSHESTAEFGGGERHWALVQMGHLDQQFD